VSRRPEGGTIFSCYLPKEMKAPSPLPIQFTGRTDRNKTWRLVTLLGYLAAELTSSRAVEIQLRGPKGELTTVAAMGPTAEQWLVADLGSGKNKTGALRVGCPMEGETYGQATVAQLQVIAEMTALALSYLTPDGPDAGGASTSSQVAKVTDAVRSILQIRRSGIPTSSSQALDLVDKLGRQLGVGATNIRRLQYAALLHDAGMARVEVEIVMGESELSWDQRDEVDRHVEQGLDLMAPLLPDPDIVTVIRHHHERVDGEGYPDRLKGREIPLGARLLAVIDAWFALTRDRTFRPGLPVDEALHEIKSHTGTQFDSDVVTAFENVLIGEGIIPGSPAGTEN
jgi:HD-GYP domain-containing protein (c-di-GMP phosphodiesterase class II)